MLVAAIRRTVHSALSHLVGAWQVRVSASDGRGHWDLQVRGAFGRHIAWFWASSDRLAEAVERRLRTFLQGVVVPLALRPRRPARGEAIERVWTVHRGARFETFDGQLPRHHPAQVRIVVHNRNGSRQQRSGNSRGF